jgi:DNA polymerase-3 subunit chi
MMMTRIDFYTGVADPLRFACRLTHTVYKKGERLIVWFGDDEALSSFSTRLWCLGDTLFVPHCRIDDTLAPETPVWLTCKLPDADQLGVLLNLGPDYPAEPGRFSRILEIVGSDEASIAAARRRFKTYREHGFAIEHHDMSQHAS